MNAFTQMGRFALTVVLSVFAAFSASAQSAPYAHTQAAGPITATNATLNGMVVPNGLPTTAWFEWGTNSSYGNVTSPIEVGTENSVVRVSAVIGSLSSGITYHCRLVASNEWGITHGAGTSLSLGLKVTAWGDNNYGQVNVPLECSNNVVAIAAGRGHSLALTTAGRVLAWGLNNMGQTNVPVALDNVVAVAAGRQRYVFDLDGEHSLALRADGTVVAWGNNGSGQTDVPVGLSNVIAIAAGAIHSLALKADGTVEGWGGRFSYDEANVPPGLSNIVAIGAGTTHSLAVKADGTVVGWGNNRDGQLNVPSGLSNVVAVVGGDNCSMALKADGTVVKWGWNDSTGQMYIPAGLSNITTLTLGANHGLALQSEGNVVSWGHYDYDLTNISSLLVNAAAIASGGKHSLALGNARPRAHDMSVVGSPNSDLLITLAGDDSNGDALTFQIESFPSTGAMFQYDSGLRGDPITSLDNVISDSNGRLLYSPATNGFGFPFDSFTFTAKDALDGSSPAQVTINIQGEPPRVFTQPAAPVTLSSAVVNGFVAPNWGNTFAWFEWGEGSNFGNLTATTEVGGVSNVVRMTAVVSNLVAGAIYQFRLVASNALGIAYGTPQLFGFYGHTFGWGESNYGQFSFYPDRNHDVAIKAGSRHSLSLAKDGSVGVVGQFYINSSQSIAAYVPEGLSNAVAIASGDSHCLAVRSNGTVVAWGGTRNFDGAAATNVPPGLNNVVAVAGGQQHSLALRLDGSVVAWGNNTYGQTNVPAGLSNVVAVAAGDHFSLALRSDGSITPWGRNNYGQIDIPADVSNVTAIAAGAGHGLALRSNGTVAAWGAVSLNYGQTNVPVGLSNVVAIAAGRYHSLALRADGSVVAWGQNTYGQTNVPTAVSNCVAIAGGERHSMVISAQPAVPRAAVPWGTHITSNSARLEGFVIPNGLPSEAWFEWWPRSGAFTNSTPAESVGDGTAVVYQTADLVGLVQGGIYHCRSVISNEAGVAFSLPGAFTTGQRIVAWGLDSEGQTTVPPGLSNVVALAAGQYHAVALKSDGALVGWGRNSYGQAVFPPEATNVIALAAGLDHTLALREDGTVLGWGHDTYGKATVPSGLSNVVAIAANGYCSLALKSDGTVAAWGGLPSTPLSNIPAGLSNVTSISASFYHGVAVREDGAYRTWGSAGPTLWLPNAGVYSSIAGGLNYSVGILQDASLMASVPGYAPPAGFTNALEVAAGFASFYGLEPSGKVFAWGSGNYGALDVPPGLTNAVVVSGGYFSGYALSPDVPYVISSDSFSGYVNADLPISLPARDPNGDPLTFRIASLPAEGSLYQYDSGVRGAAITALDAAVTDPSGRVIFAPDFDGVGSPYTTFNFTVNDGVADSAPAAVTVNIVLPPVPQIVSTNSGWSTNVAGAFELNFTGASNAVYSAYASTNLVDWERLGLATQVTNGVFQFLDLGATNWPQRYYRAGAP